MIPKYVHFRSSRILCADTLKEVKVFRHKQWTSSLGPPEFLCHHFLHYDGDSSRWNLNGVRVGWFFKVQRLGHTVIVVYCTSKWNTSNPLKNIFSWNLACAENLFQKKWKVFLHNVTFQDTNIAFLPFLWGGKHNKSNNYLKDIMFTESTSQWNVMIETLNIYF